MLLSLLYTLQKCQDLQIFSFPFVLKLAHSLSSLLMQFVDTLHLYIRFAKNIRWIRMLNTRAGEPIQRRICYIYCKWDDWPNLKWIGWCDSEAYKGSRAHKTTRKPVDHKKWYEIVKGLRLDEGARAVGTGNGFGVETGHNKFTWSCQLSWCCWLSCW